MLSLYDPRSTTIPTLPQLDAPKECSSRAQTALLHQATQPSLEQHLGAQTGYGAQLRLNGLPALLTRVLPSSPFRLAHLTGACLPANSSTIPRARPKIQQATIPIARLNIQGKGILKVASPLLRLCLDEDPIRLYPAKSTHARPL